MSERTIQIYRAQKTTNQVIDTMTATEARYIFLKDCQGCLQQLTVHVIYNILENERETTIYKYGVSCREVIISTIILKALGIKVSRDKRGI